MTMHGNDLHHPRSRRLTRAALGRYDLVATVSSELAEQLARRGPHAAGRGAALRRRPRPLPAHPARGGPRAARPRPRRAATCSSATTRPAPTSATTSRSTPRGDTTLLTLGKVAAGRGPALAQRGQRGPRAVRQRGLRARRARGARVRRPGPRDAVPACTRSRSTESPAACAPTTTAPPGAQRCAPHLGTADPRVAGRARAALFSAERMAARVVAAWQELLAEPVASATEAPPEGAV